MTTTSADIQLVPDFGRLWVDTLFETFLDRTGALGELDRRAGDGDFGTNVSSALRRARQSIDVAPPSDYSGWLTAISRGFLGTGGTSGPLFGMFFRDIARCAATGEPTLGEFSSGLTAGLATVQRYGKAQVGHKTMVDALAPAAGTLESAVAAGAAPGTALEKTARAAVGGARGTIELIAKRGRASYVGDVARGVLDPGAAAAAMLLQAAALAQAGPGGRVDTSWIDG
ncbi:DAK2 domain-containing protein [Prauserella endophytica]|uniref:DAK2 domain-containing protein n=1 Tax=Prauserella endophytica TaxID=1592324 RepID=A0ABY2RXY7_9PSEU|nr:DAK2 domain-containing protein [Prauserella endophytica]TKG64922.1 DAK2 domain-containing protein [Prauserella endophytica]